MRLCGSAGHMSHENRCSGGMGCCCSDLAEDVGSNLSDAKAFSLSPFAIAEFRE